MASPAVHPPLEAAETGVDHYRVLNDMLNRNTRWAEIADAKAGAVLLFVGATLRYLADPIVESAEDLNHAGTVGLTASDYMVRAAFVGAALLALVAVFWAVMHAFRTLVPRVAPSRSTGMMFFGDIARLDEDQWRRELANAGTSDIIADLMGQVYATGRIADRKHLHARNAIRGVFALLMVAPIVYLLSVAAT